MRVLENLMLTKMETENETFILVDVVVVEDVEEAVDDLEDVAGDVGVPVLVNDGKKTTIVHLDGLISLNLLARWSKESRTMFRRLETRATFHQNEPNQDQEETVEDFQIVAQVEVDVNDEETVVVVARDRTGMKM